jgi:predicted secreted protein
MTCHAAQPAAECTELLIEPACVNISLIWGTDNELEVTITDGDGKAIAINNDTITLTVKDAVGGTTVIAKSNGPGAHSDPGNGKTVFVIAAADTALAPATTTTYWAHEVRRITATLEERVHIQGDFIVGATL